MYFNTTMSNSFFIVSMTGLILFCIYFSMFLIQKFIFCSKFPVLTATQNKETLAPEHMITKKKCCEGTWKGLTSSVILVLILTGIVTIVSFGIFFFTVRYLYSAPASTTVSTVMQPLSDKVLEPITKKVDNVQPQYEPLSEEELKVLQERNIQGNVRRETAISEAAAKAAKALEKQNIQGNIERQTRLGEIEAAKAAAEAAAEKKEELYKKAAEANAREYEEGITKQTKTGVVENILKKLDNNNFVDAVQEANAQTVMERVALFDKLATANTQAAANAPTEK